MAERLNKGTPRNMQTQFSPETFQKFQLHFQYNLVAVFAYSLLLSGLGSILRFDNCLIGIKIKICKLRLNNCKCFLCTTKNQMNFHSINSWNNSFKSGLNINQMDKQSNKFSSIAQRTKLHSKFLVTYQWYVKSK